MSYAEREKRKVTRLNEKVTTVVRNARVAANDAADARFSSKPNRAQARARDAEQTAAAAGCKKRFSTIIKTRKFNCFVDHVVVDNCT